MRRLIAAMLAIMSGCSNNGPTIEPLPPSAGTAATGSSKTGLPAPTTTTTVLTSPLDVRMVTLTGGTFTMGTDGISPEGQLDDSRPSHWATVPPFRIDITEVTVDAYRRCLVAGTCSLPVDVKPEPVGDPNPCNWAEPNRGSYPVNCVTWYQAEAYCRWAGKQLPTEEMWEFAARGKMGRDFPWGSRVPNQRWGAPMDVIERLRGTCTGRSTADEDTCPVGSAPKGATPEGVLDLAGNVSEWTASAHCEYGKKTCDDRRKMARGGNNDWSYLPHRTHAVFRFDAEPGFAYPRLGFRCAKLDKP